MELTSEQVVTLRTQQDLRFRQNGVDYVVPRSEVYDRLRSSLDADHNELRMLLARAAQANGWDDAGMEAYDSYPHKS
jgi:hypothetical protein